MKGHCSVVTTDDMMVVYSVVAMVEKKAVKMDGTKAN